MNPDDALPSELDPLDEILATILILPAEDQGRAVDRYAREHPEQADDLRERLEALHALELQHAAAESNDFPERLGRLKLLERLGVGGMGVVYRALDEDLGREVVVKLIRPEQLYFPKSRERFRREVEAVARLRHPGIVPVYAVGEEQGLPYFTMEYVRGRTLAEVLDSLVDRAPESLRGGDLHPAFRSSWVGACVEVVRQVAQALEHAHRQSILHRDIKPSNILIDDDGRARLFDFGLSASSSEQTRLTASGSQIGTLLYMAPEQVQGDRCDGRTDVYALGLTLYELLALQHPFAARDRRTTERRILDGRADPLHPRNRRVSTDVETVCAKAMSAEPARRYGSARTFAEDLGRLLDQRPIAARPAGGSYRLRRWARRQPTLAAVSGVMLVLMPAVPTSLYLQARAHGEDLQGVLDKKDEAQNDAEAVTELITEIFQPFEVDAQTEAPANLAAWIARGRRSVEARLQDQPLRHAKLLRVLGRLERQLGMHTESVADLQRSLSLLAEAAELRELAPYKELLADSEMELAESWLASGAPEAARDAAERAWKWRCAALGEPHPRSLISRACMARLEAALADPRDHEVQGTALSTLRAICAELAEHPEAGAWDRARVHAWLGARLFALGTQAADNPSPSLPDVSASNWLEDAGRALTQAMQWLEQDGRQESAEGQRLAAMLVELRRQRNR